MSGDKLNGGGKLVERLQRLCGTATAADFDTLLALAMELAFVHKEAAARIEALEALLRDTLEYVEDTGRAGFYDEGGSDLHANAIRQALASQLEGD